ncbi:hypothetical protein RI845_08025 [Thalassotalea nanhaiensis]|uniref:DUF4282 domain-containing protein n=1 Tax=Thalassotalea nanhaiensis TaxID=3065648 RepID=A0ABY9TMK0_9GAMM|nr:hypothetical protein RI845_08025 [Colwelliaceae bacterium SQ345]
MSYHSNNNEHDFEQFQGDEFEIEEHYYEDSFDEFDYHEAGVEEGLGFLEFAGIAALLGAFNSNQNHVEHEEGNSSAMFWFLVFLPFTFPLLVMAMMVIVPYQILKFVFKLLFKVIQACIATKPEKAKPLSSVNSKNVTKQSANNYVAKTTKNSVNANVYVIDEMEAIDIKIKKLERQKQQLNQQTTDSVKDQGLNNAGRGYYYESNSYNIKKNATKLAEQATIKYI